MPWRHQTVCGITRGFPRLSPTPGQVAHVLRTRPPRKSPERLPARLACIRHAASVDPEPGSNSPPLGVAVADNPVRLSGPSSPKRGSCALVAALTLLACCVARYHSQHAPPPKRRRRCEVPLAPSSAHDVEHRPTATRRFRPLVHCASLSRYAPNATAHRSIAVRACAPGPHLNSAARSTRGSFPILGTRRAYRTPRSLSRECYRGVAPYLREAKPLVLTGRVSGPLPQPNHSTTDRLLCQVAFPVPSLIPAPRGMIGPAQGTPIVAKPDCYVK
jgi:hypothetical protein